MKNTISILFALFTAITIAAQQHPNLIVVNDMDSDGIADTVRIDSLELRLVYSLSSQDFRRVSSYEPEKIFLDYTLQPAVNGFMLYKDNKHDALYREEYIFTFNPEYNRMQLSTLNLKYSVYELELPGIALAPEYKNCHFYFDLEKGRLSFEYSEDGNRTKKVFTGKKTTVPFRYFRFRELPYRLSQLSDILVWGIMDELYPREQRTAEFYNALPVDPRSRYLLVHNIDGDHLADTVRIYPNSDDWTIIIECRLSTKGFKPVSTSSIGYDPRYTGLKPAQGGFVLRTNNTESDTYETSDVFIYDPRSGKMLFSSSHSKHELLYTYLPDRIYGISHGAAEIHFRPMEGRYNLDYKENGKPLTKEYIGKAITISLEDFLSENHQQEAELFWHGLIQSIMDIQDYPAHRETPVFFKEATMMNDTLDYFELYMNGDDKPEIVTVDKEKRVIILQLSGADSEVLYTSHYLNINSGGIFVGSYGKTLIIKSIDLYYCFDYYPEHGKVLLSCKYWNSDSGEPKSFYREDMYYPLEGFVQEKIKTYRGEHDGVHFDENKYKVLWENRRVKPVMIPFDGLDLMKLNPILTYLEKQMENTRISLIEIPEELIP